MDWLSPLVSGVVGLGALAVAWRSLTSNRNYEAARWHRERRADAYVELLEVAEDVSHAVATAYPAARRVHPPSDERQARARARVAAFGSPAVKAAVGLWLAAATEALRAADVLNAPRPEGIRLGQEAVDRYTDGRNAERLARTALDQAINDDLNA